MAHNGFNKSILTNLKQSLSKEVLLTGHSGSYHCTTVAGCNTRKYHGLLVCPVEALGGERYVLLSSLDVSLMEHGSKFNLAIHQYPQEQFYPNGHKYLYNFSVFPNKKTVFRMGDVILETECIFSRTKDQIFLKYTLKDAQWDVKIRFKPLLAFRNIHELTQANVIADTRGYDIDNGIKYRLYDNFPYLHIQYSKPFKYTHIPQWYYQVEYSEELKRGYDFKEDLLCPGYFDLELQKGESIYISVSTREIYDTNLSEAFNRNTPKPYRGNRIEKQLKKAADQFIFKNRYGTHLIAGYPWFGPQGREALISLPGLTLWGESADLCQSVLDTMANRMQDGLFPNFTSPRFCSYNSVDAPLWFIWAIAQYALHQGGGKGKAWERYGSTIKAILKSFKQGTSYNIKMQSNGLIYAGEEGKALTWMDAVVNGKPVTPRIGYPVEVNALWYYALQLSMELAHHNRDTYFIDQWEGYSELIKGSFMEFFWDDKKGYLADYVLPPYKDWALRPNQIIAASLPYSPLSQQQKKSVVNIVEKELLTPRGLRTLSPKNEFYKGHYQGNENERSSSCHQGNVWPWLLAPYCQAYLDIYKEKAIPLLEKILSGFDSEMERHGIGSISELFEGDPPHKPRGALSYAPSVSALLQIKKMIKKTKSRYSQIPHRSR